VGSWQLNKYKEIIKFDNYNISFLSKHFKLRYFSKYVKQNKDHVLEFIKHDPTNIRYADTIFLYDKQIMELVIKEYPNLYEYLPEKLQDDTDIKEIEKNAREKVSKYRQTLGCYPLCNYFYLDKKLTDEKYTKMREEKIIYDKNIERERLIREEEYKKKEEIVENMDKIYKEKNNLSPNTQIYRNSCGEIITQQEYLDDYYENHHHHINGYE